MQIHEETVEPTPTVVADRTETRISDPYGRRQGMAIKLTQTIYLVFGLIEALLLIRFVLKLLGADAQVGFAQLIYGITGVLVAPFVGLFGVSPAATGATVEPYTLVAMVVYAAVGWLLARIVWLLFGETRSASVSRTDTVRTRVP